MTVTTDELHLVVRSVPDGYSTRHSYADHSLQPQRHLVAFGRPQIVISSYRANDLAQMGKKFKLKIGFNNAGTLNAINTQAVFTSADVVPTDTGGVLALGSIPLGGQVDTAQTFFVREFRFRKKRCCH